MKLDLVTPLIEDQYVRENFQRILDFFRVQNHLFNFRQFELIFSQAVTNYQHKHNLGFLPKDVILTSVIGAGSVTFNYGDFTKEFISITTTGPCVVRFFLGAYGG